VLRLIPLLSLLFLFVGSAALGADTATLSVRGNAELQVPADQALFSLAVVTEDESSERALNANNEAMERVLTALARAGLDEKEMKTGQFTISPRWSQRPRQASAEWRPQIVGFSVTNRLQVQTGKLDRVGKFVAAAVDAGGNQVSGLSFDLADPTAYRREAIRIAMEKARLDATVLADAAEVKLGRILTLNIDSARAEPPVVRGRFMAEAAMATSEPPMMAGDVTVRASVTAVYELE